MTASAELFSRAKKVRAVPSFAQSLLSILRRHMAHLKSNIYPPLMDLNKKCIEEIIKSRSEVGRTLDKHLIGNIKSVHDKYTKLN